MLKEVTRAEFSLIFSCSFEGSLDYLNREIKDSYINRLKIYH